MKKNQNKYKLPCITWVATGECPYGNNCQYIHMDELKHNGKKIKNKKINKFSKNDFEESLIFYPFSESLDSNEYVSHYETTNKNRLEVFISLSGHNKENLNNKNKQKFKKKIQDKKYKTHYVPDYSDNNIGPAFLDSLIKSIQL